MTHKRYTVRCWSCEAEDLANVPEDGDKPLGTRWHSQRNDLENFVVLWESQGDDRPRMVKAWCKWCQLTEVVSYKLT